MRESDLFTPEVLKEWSEHALRDFPNEACGYIYNGQYFPLPNVSHNPTQQSQPPAEQFASLIISGQIDCFCHTHPNGPNYPSGPDTEASMALDIPCAIMWTNGEACLPPFAWGDTLEPLPLIGRPFRHFVSDCYRGIRDSFRVDDGVKILDFARSWDWWYRKEDLYSNFGKAGFVQVDSEDVRVGDVALMQFPIEGITEIHHAGRLRENGLIYHHPASKGSGWQPRKRSELRPLETFVRGKVIKKWVRYVG